MKILKYAFIIAVVLGLAAFIIANVIPKGGVPPVQQQGAAPGLSEGDRVPSFSLRDLAGKEKTLGDYRDKLILVNFWASWCGPCNEEASSLEAMYQQLHSRGVIVVAISIDHRIKPVDRFIKKYAITFPVLLDPEENIASEYGITGVPETFILDSDHRLIKHIIGPLDWTSGDVMGYLSTLMAGGK